MSQSYTQSESTTFTITNAKYLASKVEADLMRLHRFYDRPRIDEIREYYEELVLLQTHNYLSHIEYGFEVNGEWVKALKYSARQGGILTADDDPGGIQYSEIPQGATFSSVLYYNSNWHALTDSQRAEFRQKNPVPRSPGKGPNGSWTQQRAYSSGGRGLLRSGI